MELISQIPGPEVIKHFFMLNSDEHEICLPINVKVPTIVQENNILGLPEPEKTKFLVFLYL